MKLVPSYDINHDILKKGIYISRIDDDITTYDIRLKEPNRGDYLTNSALHTIEHIIKKYVRDSEFGDNIICFAPMGSRTGFFLVARNLSDKYIIELVKEAFNHVAEYWGKIPNISNKECGNCLEHNLPQAKEEAKEFLEVIRDWTKDDLEYPKSEIEE
ncbi:MAG: S-ribosylhomocysteine lyase [Eubacterium sp.]|nr:S-ribosylhomocysteine lyase [Eubacterium sp.]